MRYSEPKTARSRRSVALDADTVRTLREHHARQAAERLAAGREWIENGLVFSRSSGGPLHPQSLYVALVRHAKAAAVPVIRVHDLRHTYATLALEAGVHPKVVADRLGHASIAITLDTYSHVVPSVASAAAEVVAGVIFRDR